MNNLEKILDFLHIVGKLKKTYRFNADPDIDGDSGADHSWRLALMAFVLAGELNLKIDIVRAMKIALIHDIAEALTGDIDARDIKINKISKAEKKKNEEEAIEKICGSLPENIAKEISDLWLEYEEAKTQEASYTKALDKIETQIQTLEYGHEKYDDPELIGVYGIKEVDNFPELKNFFALVKEKLKEEFAKGNFEWRNDYEIK